MKKTNQGAKLYHKRMRESRKVENGMMEREYCNWKTLWWYIKDHRKTICLLVTILLLEAVLNYLYHVSFEMTLYFSALLALILTLCFCIDFYRYRKKHLELLYLKNEILVSSIRLPHSEHLLEQDYQELMKILEQTLIRLRTDTTNSAREMTDYYTLWVHQIKTPIAAMRLILQEEDSEKSRELSAELFRIEQYVELVLQYIRLESSSTDYNFKMQELDPIVRQTVRKYAPLFIRKKLGLHYEPPNCGVLTDEKWLCFVLEQILSNALKYTENGSISIYMMEKILVIEDTGIGIAPDDLPRICEKSFTGYNGRRDKKASGLGLYLSNKILRKLGHGLKIESEPGVGTKVMISLSSKHVEYE